MMSPAARLQMIIELTQQTVDEDGVVTEPVIELTADEIIALLNME